MGALSALSCGRAGSVRLVVTPPGVLRVEYGVARGATRRRFLQARHRRDLHTRIITHFHQGLAPPHDRWRRCGAPRTMFSAASAFPRTDTPEDPAVLRPSYRHANPPKDFKPHEELDLSPNRPTRFVLSWIGCMWNPICSNSSMLPSEFFVTRDKSRKHERI